MHRSKAANFCSILLALLLFSVVAAADTDARPKISGAWDEFKGLPEGTSVTAPPGPSTAPSKKAQVKAAEAAEAAAAPAEEPAAEEADDAGDED